MSSVSTVVLTTLRLVLAATGLHWLTRNDTDDPIASILTSLWRLVELLVTF